MVRLGQRGVSQIEGTLDQRRPTVRHEAENRMASRLHVRLDAERRQQLDEIAQEWGTTISDAMRRLIDDAYEAATVDQRRELVGDEPQRHEP